MQRFMLAVGLGLVSTCAAGLGVVGIAISRPRSMEIVYERALVLRPDTTTFDSVPSGFDRRLMPDLFVDERGLGIEASSLAGRQAVVRWNGSAFRPGPGPSPTAHAFASSGSGDEVSLPDGTRVRHAANQVWVVNRDDSPAPPVALPLGYQLRTVVAAGVHRVLVVPDREETRTFFFDTSTRALAPGPATPAWMSTIAGSDRAGTAVLVPGDHVMVTALGGFALALGLAAIGMTGLARLSVLVARGRLRGSGATIGMVLGIVGLVAAYVSFVDGMRSSFML